MQDKLTINLGLENNNHTSDVCVAMFNGSFGANNLLSSEVCESTYLGNVEKTLILRYENIDLWSFELCEQIRQLAVKTTQDCIALKYNGVGVVINRQQPDTVIFDEQYFVN